MTARTGRPDLTKEQYDAKQDIKKQLRFAQDIIKKKQQEKKLKEQEQKEQHLDKVSNLADTQLTQAQIDQKEDMRKQLIAAYMEKIQKAMQKELQLKMSINNSVKKTLEKAKEKQRKSTITGQKLTSDQIADHAKLKQDLILQMKQK